MGFLSDLNKSDEAVQLVAKHLVSEGYEIRVLSREEQHLGDLESTDGSVRVEVKFDIMAKRTGNLCFEMSNGKRRTGIMETQADFVYYVVPGDGKTKTVFVFDTNKLRDYIQQPSKVKIKNGGDKKKFILAIARISHIVADGLPEKFFVLEG